MVAAINWESSPSMTSYETTDLNALADGASVIGAAIDNSSGLDMYMDVEINLAEQASARDAGAYVSIQLASAPDGTNYWDEEIQSNKTVAVIPYDAADATRRNGAQMIPVPPGLFKLECTNETGQAWAATGNVMSYRLYSVESQ